LSKKTKVLEHTRVDHKTGEILEQKSISTYQSNSEDFFVKVYLDNIQYLRSLTTSEIVILFVFLKYIDYKNMLNITLRIKKKVIADTGYSMQTINNALSSLTKKKMLTHMSMGSYSVNPWFIGKGGWKDISELRMVLKKT